jgi:iron complex transport system substrate-binding protein
MRGWPLLLLLSGCSGQPAITPDGIVSNNPCIDAVLAEIAAPGQIAAVSIYSHNADSASAPLEWARKLPALGTSAEEIIAARPRLVLTGNLASTGTNAALAKAEVKTVAVGVASNVAGDIAQVRQIANAIGRVEAGEKLVTRIQRSIGKRADDGASKPSAIIWQNGGFVAGDGTLQDELLGTNGFANASKTYGLKSWDILPLETLIRNPPDVIFMPATAKGDDAKMLSARMRILRHVADKTKIVAFPDKLLFCGGPTTIKVSQIFAATREKIR